MRKGYVFFTEIQEQYQKKNMEHMIGEKLLEAAICKAYGLKLKNEPRSRGEHGKPFFTLRPAIHYNISHSGNLVYCILAPVEVGIDVQVHRKANYRGILERIVPAEMIPEIQGADEPVKAFFTQWVLREAYIKWTGEGLSRDLRKISLDEGWYELFTPKEGYSGAVYAAFPLELVWESVEISL